LRAVLLHPKIKRSHNKDISFRAVFLLFPFKIPLKKTLYNRVFQWDNKHKAGLQKQNQEERMKKQIAHLTFKGKPLCEHGYHHWLIWNTNCEQPSIRDAREEAARLNRKDRSKHRRIKVVVGHCPIKSYYR
jgi:hypothetical protein